MSNSPLKIAGSSARIRLDTIQGLRFIAALMVIICHSTFYTHNRLEPDFELYSRAANGVVVFFTISGLVMLLSFESSMAKGEGAHTFFKNRLFRIAPLYLIATLFKVAIVTVASGVAINSSVNIMMVIKSLLFIPTINESGRLEPLLGVGWTLNFEMAFYTLISVAILLKVFPYLIVAPVVILFSILASYATPDWPIALQFYSNAVALNFIFGMIAASLLKRRVLMPGKAIAPAIIVSGIMLFTPLYAGSKGHLLTDHAILDALASFTLVYSLASWELGQNIITPKILSYLGAASYSMYLVHPIFSPIAAEAFSRMGLNYPIIATFIGVMIGVIGGVLVYKFVETPISNRLLKR